MKSRKSASSPDTLKKSKSRPTGRPSDRLNPKTVDPFDNKVRHRTEFSAAYVNGAIPCRLVHGSVKHSLQWMTPPEDLPYDPLIITMIEGLREVVHPYSFIVKNGLSDMLTADNAPTKIVPLLPKLIPPLRLAMQEQDKTIFESCLQTLNLLSDAVGSELNVFLKTLLPQLSKRLLIKDQNNAVSYALQRLERNGGKAALTAIKAKIPTYISVCS